MNIYGSLMDIFDEKNKEETKTFLTKKQFVLPIIYYLTNVLNT